MPCSGILRRVALVRTDNSEERIASITILMIETIRSSDTSALKEPHGVTSQKMTFFVVIAVKISDLTNYLWLVFTV
jgi:hypothetical protein